MSIVQNDCLVADAVFSEPFSGVNSLLTGKITGKNCKIGHIDALSPGWEARHYELFDTNSLESAAGNIIVCEQRLQGLASKKQGVFIDTAVWREAASCCTYVDRK